MFGHRHATSFRHLLPAISCVANMRVPIHYSSLSPPRSLLVALIVKHQLLGCIVFLSSLLSSSALHPFPFSLFVHLLHASGISSLLFFSFCVRPSSLSPRWRYNIFFLSRVCTFMLLLRGFNPIFTYSWCSAIKTHGVGYDGVNTTPCWQALVGVLQVCVVLLPMRVCVMG